MTCEAVYCFDKASVRFALYPDGFDGTRVLAEISEDALRDVFGARGNGDSLVETCKMHFSAIEARALEHYRAVPRGSLNLVTDDFSFHGMRRGAVQPPSAGPANASHFAPLTPATAVA